MIATMQLSDVKIGKINDVNNKRYLGSKNQPDLRSEFTLSFEDKKRDKKEISQTLVYRVDNFPISVAEAYHRNYLIYLEKCWNDHLGAVFTPDILWNSILCELSSIVKEAPEIYRSLFTDSAKNKEIVVLREDPAIMPLSVLVDALKGLVPTDSDLFLPAFSTSTLRSKHAFNANFADMCSPYDNYSMFCCSIPVIEVRGTEDDYEKIASSWEALKALFLPQQAYMEKIATLIRNIITNIKASHFWQKMFSLKPCGSGSQVEVSGWEIFIGNNQE